VVTVLEQCLDQVGGYEASAAGHTVLWHLRLVNGYMAAVWMGKVYRVARHEDCSCMVRLQLLYC